MTNCPFCGSAKTHEAKDEICDYYCENCHQKFDCDTLVTEGST